MSLSSASVYAAIQAASESYIIYGSGGFVRDLIKQIKHMGLPLPDSIVDEEPSCESIEGVSVLKMESVELKPDTSIVLGSTLYAQNMRVRIQKRFPSIGEDCFVEFDPELVLSGNNELYRIEHFSHSGFLYCEGSYAREVDAVEVTVNGKRVGQAHLQFTDFRNGGEHCWKFEGTLPAQDTAEACLGFAFKKEGKILEMRKQSIDANAWHFIYPEEKSEPSLESPHVQTIFVEHPALANQEHKNQLSRLLLKNIYEYFKLFGYKLILVTFSGRLVSELGFEQIPLPSMEVDAEQLATVKEGAEYQALQKRVEESAHKTCGINFYNHFKDDTPDIDGIASTLSERAAQFEQLILKHRPKLFIAWGEYNVRSPILRAMCDHHDVPHLIAHEGLIPESLQIDKQGEFSRSFPCRGHDTFEQLPVSQEDLQRASTLIDEGTARSSRNKQSPADAAALERLRSIRASGRKVIFYVGCNDWLTGMHPVWAEHGESKQSPFVDSYDALNALIDVATKHDWHILFKPHPHYNTSLFTEVLKRHEGFDDFTVSYTGSVFEMMPHCDTLVTLMSSAAYEAMANDIPVVMLSTHPMSGKGIVYECEHSALLAESIETALAREGWAERVVAWKQFYARLMKYYLFPASADAAQKMNRSVDEAARYLLKQIR